MKDLRNWTDEELIQVYDLQEKYAEKVIDFVRHEEESEVLKFMNLISAMHSCDDLKIFDKEIYRKNEFVAEMFGKKIPQGRFVYKDLFEKWQGADSLREIFDEKYMWEFAEAQPTDLALFSGNKEVALGKYSDEKYEKLREEIPQKLQSRIKNFMMNYPEEIREKAMRTEVLGYVSHFQSSKLWAYRNENMPEFERITEVTQGEKTDTIVDAYDLQVGLKIYNDDLKNEGMTAAIREFLNDKRIFEIVHGEKSAELLSNADDKVVKLASCYDFVNTEEKLPVLENHKICLFGTADQKLKIYNKDGFSDVADKDFEIILEELAKKYEREGFSKKYYPSKSGNKNYSKQSYKVIGRVKTEDEIQPQWNIIFDDGKIVTAKADEIISSAINERFYGEQVENFGKRPLSEVLISTDNEKLSLSEGQEKISAIINQLQKNGESVSKLQEILKFEQKNLSYAR